MPNPTEILNDAYQHAIQPDFDPDQWLNAQAQAWVQTIIQYAEHHKAVLAAAITSLAKKIHTPIQDIRQHKVELPNGYSGRGFDFQYVTPFLKRHFRRLSMAESGWLTRSIEQLAPFTLDFPGRVRNPAVKTAFLSIIHDVQVNNADPQAYLYVILSKLADAYQTPLHSLENTVNAAPTITVSNIVEALKEHFFSKYKGAGSSRLPVLAIYSIYQLLLDTPRYEGKKLSLLKSHTTADVKSHSIGDVEIVGENEHFFEAIEIKHGIPITSAIVETVEDKIRGANVVRYYVLTTAEPNIVPELAFEVLSAAQQASIRTGCEIILNGILPSLKYYLRLIPNLNDFLDAYTQNLQADYSAGTDVKRVHLDKWNEILKQFFPE